MPYSLSYVFIPGDDWPNITMSPGVTKETARRVLETMRSFASQPRFEEYLLNGGVGWTDIPWMDDGLRLHYRPLVRRPGSRPLIFGIGFFHDRETRQAAGGLAALAVSLDKSLAKIDPANSFPNDRTFSMPVVMVPPVAPGVNGPSWIELRGETIIGPPEDIYKIISEHCAGEDDWSSKWKMQLNMPRIADSATTAFITPGFPVRNIPRPIERPLTGNTSDFADDFINPAYAPFWAKLWQLTFVCAVVTLLIFVIVLFLLPDKRLQNLLRRNDGVCEAIDKPESGRFVGEVIGGGGFKQPATPNECPEDIPIPNSRRK